MMWIILLIFIFIIIILTRSNQKKKNFIILGIIAVALAIIGGIYYFSNICLNPNWLLEVEETGIDGMSNKVYIYENGNVVVEYPLNLYNRTKGKLSEKINVKRIYDNYQTSDSDNSTICYKIVYNTGKHEEDRIATYISPNNEELKEFLEEIKTYMVQIK